MSLERALDALAECVGAFESAQVHGELTHDGQTALLIAKAVLADHGR